MANDHQLEIERVIIIPDHNQCPNVFSLTASDLK